MHFSQTRGKRGDSSLPSAQGQKILAAISGTCQGKEDRLKIQPVQGVVQFGKQSIDKHFISKGKKGKHVTQNSSNPPKSNGVGSPASPLCVPSGLLQAVCIGQNPPFLVKDLRHFLDQQMARWGARTA